MRPPWNPAARSGRRPRGIALLMTLVVVMLLTFFMSEFFFATGLELRAISTFKSSFQARGLSKAVFKAVQAGLMLDEVEFFKGYRQLEKGLEYGVLPWDEGLLIDLQVRPLDHLYNLNDLQNLRVNSDQDQARWEVFFHTLKDVKVPPETGSQEPEVLPDTTLQALYAALWDWIDTDDQEYTGLPSVRGAEASAYFDTNPEVSIKNGPLDRLTEIRLVKGVVESRIPWAIWEQRFAVFPKRTVNGLFPERINVNVASREEIATFLQRHRIDATMTENKNIQNDISKYVVRADEIADLLVPQGVDSQAGLQKENRTIYTQATLQAKLRGAGGLNEKTAQYLFSTINEYYGVRVVTEVDQVQARLEALVRVHRSKSTRVGTKVDILWWSLE